MNIVLENLLSVLQKKRYVEYRMLFFLKKFIID